jgi:hypothetical protein
MKIRFQADADFNEDILFSVIRAEPGVPVRGRQDEAHHPTRDAAHGVEFEAEEPALRALPEARAVFPQPHPPVPQGVAERDGLGVHQVEAGLCRAVAAGRLKQRPDLPSQPVQAVDPLCVSRQVRESRAPVLRHHPVTLLQRGDAQRALQKGDGDDFRVGEARRGVRRRPPAGERRAGSKVVVNGLPKSDLMMI